MLAGNALNDEREQIELGAARLADIQAAQHTNVIDTAKVMMEMIVETIEGGAVDDADCTHFLSDRVDRIPRSHRPRCFDSTGGPLSLPWPAIPSFRPVSPTMNFSKRSPAPTDSRSRLPRSPVRRAADHRRVAGQSGRRVVAGAVAVGIDLRWLEFLARRMNLPSGSTITAIGGNWEVLNHYRAEDVGDEELTAPRENRPRRNVPAGAWLLKSAACSAARPMPATSVSTGFQSTSSGNLSIVVGMPQYAEFERYGAALRDNACRAEMAILLLALACRWLCQARPW